MAKKTALKVVVGVDMGATNIRAALVGARGNIYGRIKRPTFAESPRDEIISRIITLISDILKQGEVKRSRLAGIGIATPGPLSVKSGIILNPPNLPTLRNVPLRRILKRHFRVPVVLDNDANAAAVGEHWMGAGKGSVSLVCITLGTGVGGGIIINNQLWRGASDTAGEIGHMTIDPMGPRCGCGNTGCLEVYVSARGIVNRMRSVVESGVRSSLMNALQGDRTQLTADLIYRAAARGDPAAKKALEDTGVILGVAVANLINLLNPRVIVIGGGIIGAGKFLFEPMRAEANKRAFTSASDAAKIVPAELTDDAGTLGAARLCILEKR